MGNGGSRCCHNNDRITSVGDLILGDMWVVNPQDNLPLQTEFSVVRHISHSIEEEVNMYRTYPFANMQRTVIAAPGPAGRATR